MLDVITLKGLTVSGAHGVYDFEQTVKQPFVVDVSMWVDISAACCEDDIEQTVSYADIADDVKSIIEGPSVHLIETLAENIAQRVLTYDRVRGVEIRVHKPQAPIAQGFDDVYVQVRRGVFDSQIFESHILDEEPLNATQDTPDVNESAENVSFLHVDQSVEKEHVEPSHNVTPFVLAFGGNQGNVPLTLVGAIEKLIDNPRIQVDAISPLLRTRAVLKPGMAAQDDHWNAVVVGTTSLTAQELLLFTSGVEDEFGRKRPFEWAPRTLDIDLIAMGDTVIDDKDLVVPHPRAYSRAFVLIPWYLLDPQAQLPGWGSIAELIPGTNDRDGIVDAIEEWWENPAQLMQDSDALIYANKKGSLPSQTGSVSDVTSDTDSGADVFDEERIHVLPEVPSFAEALVEEKASRVKPQVNWIPVAEAQKRRESSVAPVRERVFKGSRRSQSLKQGVDDGIPQFDEDKQSQSFPVVPRADSDTEPVAEVAVNTEHTTQDTGRDTAGISRPLPEWNFNSTPVTVIDSLEVESDDVIRPLVPAEQAGRRAILDPDLPEGTPIGAAQVPQSTQAVESATRRHTIRPTHTGMIPVIKRRGTSS